MEFCQVQVQEFQLKSKVYLNIVKCVYKVLTFVNWIYSTPAGIKKCLSKIKVLSNVYWKHVLGPMRFGTTEFILYVCTNWSLCVYLHVVLWWGRMVITNVWRLSHKSNQIKSIMYICCRAEVFWILIIIIFIMGYCRVCAVLTAC